MKNRIEELERKIEILEKQLAESDIKTSCLNNNLAFRVNNLDRVFSSIQQSFNDVLARL
ncbi:hypothetical protein KKI93_12590 [Xenorhabdus bovienii]|nr:hypothetical protein [Xenorhabdus bovienii]MDE9484019.1 hypothetical protein [Xenorhabdus bovienii]MDE9564873.1 hypothetical protein [Xenorhabdus bovienii]